MSDKDKETKKVEETEDEQSGKGPTTNDPIVPSDDPGVGSGPPEPPPDPGAGG